MGIDGPLRVLVMKTILLFSLLSISAPAQKRTAVECAQIRQFNAYQRAENRGMKPGELEAECPTSKPKKAPPKKAVAPPPSTRPHESTPAK